MKNASGIEFSIGVKREEGCFRAICKFEIIRSRAGLRLYLYSFDSRTFLNKDGSMMAADFCYIYSHFPTSSVFPTTSDYVSATNKNAFAFHVEFYTEQWYMTCVNKHMNELNILLNLFSCFLHLNNHIANKIWNRRN